MDTWRSDNTEDADGEVIEIIPIEEYDMQKAKARASLSWVLGKAYVDKVPSEFHDPFYETAEGHWQIKPRLANLLASSEIYCQACRNMFGESSSQWKGHWSIIQVLSRKGIYAVGSGSVDVTETILMQSAPFKIKAHLALIDGLMKALSREIASIERVTQSVRRYASFNASSELPADTEDAILFWINKVCVTVQRQLEKTQDTVIEGGETSQKVRIVSSRTPRDSISVPIMESLLKDMGDGCSLATLISFYCPQILNLEDVCLKSNVGIADSLYNLRLIRSFCDRHLPLKTCHLSYEDLLYTHQNIRENVIMMVTELFYWFEIKRLPIVTGGGFPPVVDQGDGMQSVTLPRAQSAQVPTVPISNVTKQSFNRMKGDTELRSSSTPDIHRMSSSVPPRMPLLHRRQQQGCVSFHDDPRIQDNLPGVHRTNSLTSHDLRHADPTTQSVLAWQEKNHTTGHQQTILPGIDQSTGSANLLGNVSIDSDMNASFSSGSIDLGDLDNSPRHTARLRFDQTDSSAVDNTVVFNMPQKQHTTPYPSKSENMEVESANSGVDFGVTNSQQITDRTDSNESLERMEPLMPARLKPAKEKINNHSKEEERGETPRKRTQVSPKLKKKVEIDPHLAVIDQGETDRDSVTPVPGDEGLSHGHFSGGRINDPQQDANEKRFDAFFVRGSVTDSEGMLSHRSDVTVAESYVIDNSKTPDAARAAGIPIIDNESSPGRRLSREGSIASSKSSGDFSDHESHKIHIDHKTRETNESASKGGVRYDLHTNMTSPGDYIIHKPIIMNRQGKGSDSGKATNFAQLKHMRDVGHVDNSGFVYMQHGKEDEDRKGSLKDAFQRNKAEKKTTFAPLPNQTTWQQNAANQNASGEGSPTQNGSASQELLKLRMKLEEKRKAIERKKHSQEIQQQKIRQRLGKAAFLHVVSKTKDDESVETRNDSQIPTRMTTSDSELPGTSSSGVNNGRMTSSSPLKSPAHQKIPRPFSRDDIQQTIENVRKKWFQDEDLVAPRVSDSQDPDQVPYDDSGEHEVEAPDGQITPRPVFDRRSTSVERITSLADQMDQGISRQDKSPQMTGFGRRSASVERTDPRYSNNTSQQGNVRQPDHERRSTSVDRNDLRGSRPTQGQQTNEDKPETYEEYNSSLDQLNKSLTDLQGEIMKLSLKQKQGDNGQNAEPPARSRSRSPPHVLDVVQKNLPEKSMEHIPEHSRSRTSQPTHSQTRSASEPRQLAPEPTGPEEQIGNYQSHTLPRQPGFHHGQGQVQQYMTQNPVTVAGPAGPVYGNPNQFVPVQNQAGLPPSAQQYGSYIMGPPNPQQIGQMQHQQMSGPYQHSPPQGFPGTAMYPGQPYMAQPIVSPQTQPYGTIYTSPPHTHFQQMPHPVNTYTTSVLQQQIPTSQQPLFDPNTQQVYQSPQQQQIFQQQSYPQNVNAPSPPQQQTVPNVSQTGSAQIKQTGSSSSRNVSESDKQNIEPNKTESDAASDSGVETHFNESDKSGGFFVSFNEGSPRRTKPQLSERKKSDTQIETNEGQAKTSDSDKYGSSVIADFAQRAAEQQGKPAASSDGNQSVSSGPTDGGANESQSEAVGFVIGQDDSTLDHSAEEEMLKKKERIEKMRQKRQEEQDRKRQKLEHEVQRKKEAERLKQEESERRKSEEKARREQIFKQYLQKKEDEEEGRPAEKSKQKTRPKSMFVKLGPGSDNSEGLTNSAEDVSAKASTGDQSTASKPSRVKSAMSYTDRHKMRKAVSCNTLNQNGDKSLAYGGLTHRRPPSPDLYRLRNKGQRSNEGSEAGSLHSDYSGPKLFVKPSSKSNRHIIINAISHCCLAGIVNTDLKNKVLEEIAKSSAKHFVILFRDTGCGFRSLYGFDPDTEECVKIMGVGPRLITNDMVEKYYKYNSGGKSFSCVSSTKHISVSIDALVLQNAVWKPNKGPSKGYR